MIVAALLALALARQGPTITFESSGITVMAFCAELERQTGRRFRAWDEVRNELLALRLTSAPLDTVLQKLTYAARARVRADGTTYDIRPDSAAIAKTQAEILAARGRVVQTLTEAFRPKIRTQGLDAETANRLTRAHVRYENALAPGRPSDEDERQQFETESPERQALLKLFCAIPTQEIAAIRPGDTEVWSTAPTRMEHPTPPGAEAVLHALAADSSVWSDALQRAEIASTKSDRRYYVNFDPSRAVLLRLTVTETHIGYVVRFYAYEPGGALVGIAEHRFELPEHEVADTSTQPLPTAPMKPADAVAVDLWTGRFDQWPKDQPQAGVLRVGSEMYFNPETYDPVALIFGRGLVELAQVQNDQLVANEGVMMAWGMDRNAYGGGKLNLEALHHWLVHPAFGYAADVPVPIVELVEGDGWITVRPHAVDQSAEYEFGRRAIGNYLRGARDRLTVAIGDELALASASGAEINRGGGWFLAGLLRLLPDAFPGDSFMVNTSEYLRFLGDLDSMQLAQAEKDGLPLSECSTLALDALWRAFRDQVFRRGRNLNLAEALYENRTRAIPNGLPGAGFLHITSRQKCMYRVRNGKPSSPDYERGTGEADWLIFDSGGISNGELKLFSQPGADLRPVSVTEYTIRFDFPGGADLGLKFEDRAWAGPNVTALKDLPELFRVDIDRATEAYLRERGEG